MWDVNLMIEDHDQWSLMGEAELGEHNIEWARRMESVTDLPGSGPMTLLKAILNDCWADRPKLTLGWTQEEVNQVMSKLYWCWVAWLEATHPKTEDDA
jgi:hypothetical protein